LLLKLIDTPLGVLGVHAIAALSVSEHVVVKVYSMLVIAVDRDTVWESDPFPEVNEPVIVQGEVVVVAVAVGTGITTIDPSKVEEAVAAAFTTVRE
jgi:hypothetical protein